MGKKGKMDERQKCSYTVELANHDIGQVINVYVDIENVAREKAEKIIHEMEAVKEKIEGIMAG